MKWYVLSRYYDSGKVTAKVVNQDIVADDLIDTSAYRQCKGFDQYCDVFDDYEEASCFAQDAIAQSSEGTGQLIGAKVKFNDIGELGVVVGDDPLMMFIEIGKEKVVLSRALFNRLCTVVSWEE